MHRFPHRRGGFTLVELLVVIVIIGVLGSLAVSNFHGMADSSKNASAYSNAKAIGEALERYRADHQLLPKDGLCGVDAPAAAPTTSYLLGSGATTEYLKGGLPLDVNSRHRLPLSPWANPGNAQDNDLTYPIVAPFKTATTFSTNGENVVKTLVTGPPVPDVVAATGSIPTSNMYATGDYGTIYYTVNSLRDMYIVVVVGKHNRSAVNVGAITNIN